MLEFIQGATFSLNVAIVQFNTRNHHLGTTVRLIYSEVATGTGGRGYECHLDLFCPQVIQQKCPNFKSITPRGSRLGADLDHREGGAKPFVDGVLVQGEVQESRSCTFSALIHQV